MKIGIDFGTSTIMAAKWNEASNEIEILQSLSGYGLQYLNNVVYFKNADEIVLGESAETMYNSPNAFEENYISGIKRHLLEKDWVREIKFYDENGELKTVSVTAPEVCTKIFGWLKKHIETINPTETITEVVISVPYDYSADIRNIIANSAISAGLNVIQLIEEPVAASLCYGVFNSPVDNDNAEKIMVVDFGGGTLDITAFEFKKDNTGMVNIETLAESGNSKLGGIDITNIIKDNFISELSSPLNKKTEFEIFRYFNNDVKQIVSDFTDDDEVTEIFFTGMNDEFVETELSLKEFKKLLSDNGIFDMIKEALDECVKKSGIDRNDFDKIILVGGTCKIVCIQKYLEEYFGKKPFSPQSNDIFELVGVGAGIYCKSISNNDFRYKIIPRVTYSIGVLCDGEFAPLVEGNIQYDVENFQRFNFSTADGRTSGTDILEIYQCPEGSTDISKCRKIGYIEIVLNHFPNNTIEMSLQIKNHDIIYALKDYCGIEKARGSIFRI